MTSRPVSETGCASSLSLDGFFLRCPLCSLGHARRASRRTVSRKKKPLPQRKRPRREASDSLKKSSIAAHDDGCRQSPPLQPCPARPGPCMLLPRRTREPKGAQNCFRSSLTALHVFRSSGGGRPFFFFLFGKRQEVPLFKDPPSRWKLQEKQKTPTSTAAFPLAGQQWRTRSIPICLGPGGKARIPCPVLSMRHERSVWRGGIAVWRSYSTDRPCRQIQSGPLLYRHLAINYCFSQRHSRWALFFPDTTPPFRHRTMSPPLVLSHHPHPSSSRTLGRLKRPAASRLS
jgi:hypothetical protein